MPFESLVSALSGLKHTTPVLLLGVAIATGVILFAGAPLIATLGLEAFRNENRAALGLAFIVAIGIIAAHSMYALWKLGRSVVHTMRRNKHRFTTVMELTPDEKAYIAPYIIERKNTVYYPIDDGIAQGLVSKGVLYRAANVGSLVGGWAFNMQPWARRMLDGNELLLADASQNPEGPPDY